MAKGPHLGIYFSHDFINIVEQQDGELSNFVKVPCVLEDIKAAMGKTVADETKIVNLLKEDLMNKNVTVGDTVLTLLSEDLIIRFFDIPLVPQNEIESTVGFEVKKYIPFRLDELTFDYDIKIDKKAKKIAILFIGAKKDIIDKYTSLLEQAGLNIIAIEPAFLSLLRALKLSNIEAKLPFVVLDVDTKLENGEMTVIENFYPRFSRDFNLTIEIGKQTDSGKTLLNKLINEIRISLDYCRRQFIANPININKIFFLASADTAGFPEALNKELDTLTTAYDIRESLGLRDKDLDLGLVRAYGASLMDITALPLKINLVTKGTAGLIKEGREEESLLKKIILQLDKGYLFMMTLATLGVILAVYFFGTVQLNSYNDKIKKLKQARESLPILEKVQPVTYEGLEQLENEYNKKISILDNLKKGRIYFTPKFSALAALRQKGLWLNNLNFNDSTTLMDLALDGSVYLGDEKEEFYTVNRFLSELKKDKGFSTFKDISLGSLSRGKSGEYFITNFSISCR